MFGTEYTARHRSMLKAISQGRAKLTRSQHPGLSVDGRWCDQVAASELVRGGLVRPARLAAVGTLVPAVLTTAGAAVLSSFRLGAAAA